MRIECFLDTNILLYAAAPKPNEVKKARIAQHIVTQEFYGLSAQVLAEFYVGFTRKPVVLPSISEVDRWLDLLSQFPTVPVDETLVKMAIILARQCQIHYYDAAIIAAAERLGAPLLYTEDLNHGQRYGTVLVQNPFRDLEPSPGTAACPS